MEGLDILNKTEQFRYEKENYYTICIVQICTLLRFHLGNQIAEDSRLLS